MGFSYTHLGLCCDFCSNSGPQQNVRKIACPYGWCQHWACCNVCFKAKKHLASSCSPEGKTHKELCKFLAIEYDMSKYQKSLNDIGVPVQIKEHGKCGACKQKIGKIEGDGCSCYPCLNSKCKNFCNADLIKETWQKMNKGIVLEVSA